jgi:hypothetical protein
VEDSVSGSYRKTHYVQRPAKNIERKMIVEALGRLDRLISMENVRYVGFGSIYFADFLLFHRYLGLAPMVNIEEDDSPEQRARFALNKPFSAVDLKHGRSSIVLPHIGWDQPTAFWLDYDVPINSDILGDVEMVTFNAATPAVLIVTVQATPEKVDPENPGSRVAALASAVGRERVPLGVRSNANLAGWRTATVSYEIIDGSIRKSLRERFPSSEVSALAAKGETEPSADVAPVDSPTAIDWAPLFNFQYEDGAKMVTIGGLIHERSVTERVAGCEFEKLSYVRGSGLPNDCYRIDVPRLTTRELLHLDRLLPNGLTDDQGINGIPPSEVAAYAKLYRYFPAFVDADL